MSAYKNVGTTTWNAAYGKTYRGANRDDGKVRVRIIRRGTYQNQQPLTNDEEIVVPRRVVVKKQRPLPKVPSTIPHNDESIYDEPDDPELTDRDTFRKNITTSSKGSQTEPVVDAAPYDDVVYPFYRQGIEEMDLASPYSKESVIENETVFIVTSSGKQPLPPRKPTMSSATDTRKENTLVDTDSTAYISAPSCDYLHYRDIPVITNGDTLSHEIWDKIRRLVLSKSLKDVYMEPSDNDLCRNSNAQEERNTGTMPNGYDQLTNNTGDANLMQDEEVEYLCRKKMTLEERSKKDLVKINIQKENIELLKTCRENKKTWVQLKKEERELNADIEHITEHGYGEEIQQTNVKQIHEDNLQFEKYYYWTPQLERISENRFTIPNENIYVKEPSRDNAPIDSESDDDFIDLK